MGARNGFVLTVNEGAATTTSVHVDDAARLYLLAAKHARAGEVYNATAPGFVTHREIVDAIAGLLDVPVKSLPLAVATEKMGAFLGRFLSADNKSSSAKARKEFGWEIKEGKAGIIEDIKNGSYVPVAQAIKSGAPDGKTWGS